MVAERHEFGTAACRTGQQLGNFRSQAGQEFTNAANRILALEQQMTQWRQNQAETASYLEKVQRATGIRPDTAATPGTHAYFGHTRDVSESKAIQGM
eukprot:15474327-Alexandrium_andersonii.AAC.1